MKLLIQLSSTVDIRKYHVVEGVGAKPDLDNEVQQQYRDQVSDWSVALDEANSGANRSAIQVLLGGQVDARR